MGKFTVEIKNSHLWNKVPLQTGESYFSGYIYTNGSYYTKDTIADYFKKVEFRPDLINTWTGEFALIYLEQDVLFAICDRKRSIPIFYYKNEHGWSVTDKLVSDGMHGEFNKTAIVEFLLTGFSANDKTLYQDVYQVEAGQQVSIKNEQIFKQQYYSFYHKPDINDIEEATLHLKDTFHHVFQRLYERIKDKHVMIPLSGGYDSRIIALLLKEYGVKNISSFTYGIPNNQEAKKSKEIADRLGIEWSFYEYSTNDWQSWYSSAEWNNYLNYASNGSSIAHLQDWPAVSKITKTADKQYVFIPGHSGDFIAGSHIPYELIVDKGFTINDIVDQILKKHHRLWNISSQSISNVIHEIKRSLEGLEHQNKEQASAVFEYWDWKERQSKFIINSVRVYEYYNQGWEIPLWDDELMNFFLKVPVEFRYKKYLYDKSLHYMYPDFFEKPNTNIVSPTASLRNKYGPLYPVLKKVYNKKRIYQQYFTDPMGWYGIYGNYINYLLNTTFKIDNIRYDSPYNINSFLVKDFVRKLKG